MNRYELNRLSFGTTEEGLFIVNWPTPLIKVSGRSDKLYSLTIDDSYYKVQGGHQIKTKYHNIQLTRNGQLIAEHSFNSKAQKILVHMNSYCLGDNIAWMPYIQGYYDQNKPKTLIVSTFYPEIFSYSDFNIIGPQHHIIHDLYAYYEISYNKMDLSHRSQSIQSTAAETLLVANCPRKPYLKLPDLKRPIKKPYVCIAPESPKEKAKWHYPEGWQIIVDYLDARGYQVLNISSENTISLNRCVNKNGMLPLSDRINDLYLSDFFIGLSSGLSWLAWALGKPVVMISGFTKPINEFPCYRVFNSQVCHGCWNTTTADSECPYFKNTHRQWECSFSITPDMVIRAIDSCRANNPFPD